MDRINKVLVTAAQLKKAFALEQRRIQQVIDSLGQRQAAVCGAVAMTAALGTYLGPHPHIFRRLMLTIHWPACLRERGIPLIVDRIDELRGLCAKISPASVFCIFLDD